MRHPFLFARLWHILFDVALVFSAFILGYFIRVNFVMSTEVPFWPYAGIAVLAAGAWAGIMAAGGYYKLQTSSTGALRWLLRIAGGFGGIAVLMGGHFFWQKLLFSRLMSFYSLIFGLIVLLLSFWMFEQYCIAQKTNPQKQKNLKKTLIVGGGRNAEEIIEEIKKDPYAGLQVVGVIDPSGIYKTVKGAEVLGKMNKIESIIMSENIDFILQVNGFEQAENIASLAIKKGLSYAKLPLLQQNSQHKTVLKKIGNKTINSVEFKAKNYLTALSRVLE